MKFRISLAACSLFLITGIISCKKGGDAPPPPTTFQAITFKFGPDSIAINIDAATKTVKNLSRSCDVTQLGASAVLPAGYSINPSPSTIKNYTTGVTYTLTNDKGGTYTVQITAPVYDAVNNPYGIYSAKNLSDIRKGLNDSYVLMNDIQMPDLNASNAAASVGISDYAAHGWFSIGSTYVNGGNVVFRGSLDGQNHVIKNYTANYRPSGEPNPTGIDEGKNGKNTDGIFGYANHATFKNIGIQLSTAGINDDTQDGAFGSVGALVGLVDSSTITNCFVTGNTIIKGGQYVGGLIGKSSYTNISKCYAALTPATGNYVINATGDAGGLIGWSLYGEVSDSYSTSSVIGATNLGGLIGSINTTKVNTSYASGNVGELPLNTTGGLIAPNNLGGLIGTAQGITLITIENCYATGSVAGANGTNTTFHMGTRIGGLIGNIAVSALVKVNYCYATGAVSRVHTNASAPFLIGGLVGSTVNGIFITSNTCTNYWDKASTGQNNLGGGNPALAQDNGFTTNGKTSAEMKTSSNYLNWDFSSVWTIAAGKNNGYPSLRSIN